MDGIELVIETQILLIRMIMICYVINSLIELLKKYYNE
jgi:hypothetical protein